MCSVAPYTHPLPRAPHHPKTLEEDCTTRVWASDSVAATVCRGVVDAVCELLESSPPPPQWVPQLIDERQWPLCDAHSPLTSFLWVTPHARPDARAVSEYVCLIAMRLRMTAADLALALSLLETLAIHHTGMVQPYTFRPLFYAASVVARKLTCDGALPTRDCYEAVDDLFTNTCPRAVSRIEAQMLVLVDWSVSASADAYEVYVVDLYYSGLLWGQVDNRKAVLSDTDPLHWSARANHVCALVGYASAH